MTKAKATDANSDFEHSLVPEALKKLRVDPKAGLSDADAKQRLIHYGPNAFHHEANI